MITTETILLTFHNLTPDELNNWIAHEWIKPDGPHGAYQFQDIDLARIRLILDLRDTIEITEPAMPTVLSLLDQLYTLRRQLRALAGTLPAETSAVVRGVLGE